MTFTKVTLIGSGNIAYHFASIMNRLPINLSLYARDQIEASKICDLFNCTLIDDLTKIESDSLVILCVSDKAVIEILSSLSNQLAIVYTSGTISLNSLPKRSNLGVFYPLQSFTKGKKLSQKNFPILLESSNADFLQSLSIFASLISEVVYEADSNQRKQIHIAAVFANNFSNHLWYLAQQQIVSTGLDWKLLIPLIQESAAKLSYMDPYDAQTGPARRMDQQTILDHLDVISGSNKEIYKLITESIQFTYQNTTNDKL